MNPNGHRANGAHHKLPGCPNIEEPSFERDSYRETREDKGNHLSNSDTPSAPTSKSSLEKPLICQNRIISKSKHHHCPSNKRGQQSKEWDQQDTLEDSLLNTFGFFGICLCHETVEAE